MLPRMLHCKLLRSPLPHARIVRDRHVDARAAHPGVHLVLTGDDFPIPFGILPGQPGRARALPSTACASSAIRSPPSSRATS